MDRIEEEYYQHMEENMGHKKTIHDLIKKISDEVFAFIKDEGEKHNDRWVPATHVKNSLALDFPAVPKNHTPQYGTKGWLLAIILRILEDEGRIEYKIFERRGYCRNV